MKGPGRASDARAGPCRDGPGGCRGHRLAAYALECEGITLADGCLFTITGGDTPNPNDGYAVTNADGVPLWDFVRERDLTAIGYPISQRWSNGPFTFQAFQKVILQWDPGQQRMNWYNTLDALANKYPDVELPNVPAHQVLAADEGVTDFGVIIRNHLALLDANPTIKAAFLAEPNWLNLYGLPIRYEEREVNGNPQGLQLLRAQRTVFAIWNVPAPGTTLGAVALQNVPDKIKRLSNVIIPDAVKAPTRERNLEAYFQSALERIRAFDRRHDENTLEWLSQQPWFADGLDDEEKALVVTLRAYLPEDADRLERFVGTHNVSTASISLPLSGNTRIWIYSYESFQYGDALAGMVKQAVRAAEEFLKMPFPTTDIIVAVVNESHQGFPSSGNFGSYICLRCSSITIPKGSLKYLAVQCTMKHFTTSLGEELGPGGSLKVGPILWCHLSGVNWVKRPSKANRCGSSKQFSVNA